MDTRDTRLQVQRIKCMDVATQLAESLGLYDPSMNVGPISQDVRQLRVAANVLDTRTTPDAATARTVMVEALAANLLGVELARNPNEGTRERLCNATRACLGAAETLGFHPRA